MSVSQKARVGMNPGKCPADVLGLPEQRARRNVIFAILLRIQCPLAVSMSVTNSFLSTFPIRAKTGVAM